MLYAIAREYFQAAVVELNGDVDDHLAGRRPQHFAHAVVQAEALRGFVETRFRGEARIKLILHALLGLEQRRGRTR